MTYSIVARDPGTGEMGVAVQSCYFSVGSVVPWAEAGVGVVATQSFVDPSYGPLGLDLMRRGKSASEALRALVTLDPGEARRQVAMLDSAGQVAVHTGRLCVAAAGHRLGEQVSAQANMMRQDTVWDAMVQAFKAATGDLAARLLAALDAAEEQGGDLRGRQSAALLVVGAQATGKPWLDRVIDLRVEDHPDPVKELRRLLQLKRAHDRLNRVFAQASSGQLGAALEEPAVLQQSLPDDQQLLFWHGVLLALAGRLDDARAILDQVYRANPDWAEFLRRLQAVSRLPGDPALLERLLPDSLRQK